MASSYENSRSAVMIPIEPGEKLDHSEDVASKPRSGTRDAFETPLSEEFLTFSYKNSYKDAPNPFLRIPELGTIGLPLSVREAEAVTKIHHKHPSYDRDKRKYVYYPAAQVMELDAKQVESDNPHWKTFMERVAKDVCKGLGVNYETSQPRCDLRQLLLYEPRSQRLPYAGETIFPLIHALQAMTAVSSTWETITMAWCTGVTHEVKSITSGHRLELVYSLIHTTGHICPTISFGTLFVDRAHPAMRTWKADLDNHSTKGGLHLRAAEQSLFACFETRDAKLANVILDKVTDMKDWPAKAAQTRTKDVIIPLLVFIGFYKHLHTDISIPMPRLDEILRTAITVYLQSLPICKKPSSANPGVALRENELQNLIQAVLLLSGSDLYLSTVLPWLGARMNKPTVFPAFIRALHAVTKKFASVKDHNLPDVEPLLKITSEKYAAQRALNGHQVIIKTIKLFLETGMQEACSMLMRRMVDLSLLKRDYIHDILLPLIPLLRKLANEPSMFDNFALAIQAILLAWTDIVIGNKPEDPTPLAGIPAWANACPNCQQGCQQARGFLTNNNDRNRSIAIEHIGMPARQHVETFLSRYARSAATWNTIRHDKKKGMGENHQDEGIKITKPDALLTAIQWRADCQRGRGILTSLSADETELKRILAEHYDRVTKSLRRRDVDVDIVPIQTENGSSSVSGLRRDSSEGDKGLELPPTKRRKINYHACPR